MEGNRLNMQMPLKGLVVFTKKIKIINNISNVIILKRNLRVRIPLNALKRYRLYAMFIQNKEICKSLSRSLKDCSRSEKK